MENQAQQIRDYILTYVGQHPQNIVALAAEHFKVSRTTVHRHLNKLLAEQKIVRVGKRKQAAYLLPESMAKKMVYQITPQLDEFVIWSRDFELAFKKLAPNIYAICEYGFTEMLNNVIDHSGGKSVVIETCQDGNDIVINIADNGVGIFLKIMRAFDLLNERESILALSKGKVTTDPQNHTGEGIFFTSRAFDMFILTTDKIGYITDNLQHDWFIERDDLLMSSGTSVEMRININSDRILKNIFDEYADPEQDYVFNKTHIKVELCKLGGERYISRSQAKRLLIGLEKFQHIVLDFKRVAAVGQGFVDEVFRVFQNKHPDIEIEYVNANEDVEFMIKRGLAHFR